MVCGGRLVHCLSLHNYKNKKSVYFDKNGATLFIYIILNEGGSYANF